MLASGVARRFQPPAVPRWIGFSNSYCVIVSPDGEFRCDGGRLETCMADLQSAGDGIARCLAPLLPRNHTIRFPARAQELPERGLTKVLL